MDVFAASGAGDEALVARLLEDGADCNLGDTWTGAEDGSPVLLTLMLSILQAGLPCTRLPRLATTGWCGCCWRPGRRSAS